MSLLKKNLCSRMIIAAAVGKRGPNIAWQPARGAEGHPGPALPSRCRRKAGTQHRMAARPRRRGSSWPRPLKPLPSESGDPTSEGPPLPDPSHHRCWFSRWESRHPEEGTMPPLKSQKIKGKVWKSHEDCNPNDRSHSWVIRLSEKSWEIDRQ